MPSEAPATDGLVLSRACFAYGSLGVLLDASLEVPQGGVAVIAGENGVGKSTLLYLAAGLVPASSGTVTLSGHKPDPDLPSALFRAGVRCGFLFQNGGLLSNLSALANVTLALRYHADVLELDAAGINERARTSLETCRVPQADLHALPAHLSFGLRKRVALARALAIDPNFVFLDDPDTGLDVPSLDLFHEIIGRLRDDPRVTLLVASNHDELVRHLGVRPLELVEGRLVQRTYSMVFGGAASLMPLPSILGRKTAT